MAKKEYEVSSPERKLRAQASGPKKDEKTPKGGDDWTREEYAQLKFLIVEGLSYHEISEIMGRTNQALRLKVMHINGSMKAKGAVPLREQAKRAKHARQAKEAQKDAAEPASRAKKGKRAVKAEKTSYEEAASPSGSAYSADDYSASEALLALGQDNAVRPVAEPRDSNAISAGRQGRGLRGLSAVVDSRDAETTEQPAPSPAYLRRGDGCMAVNAILNH